MYCFLSPAHLTLDFTAPVESARAPLIDDDFLRLVATTAAHQVAAVHADTGVVALATLRTQDAQLGVALAEWRRQLQVHEILWTRRLVFGIEGLQLEVVAVSPAQTLSVTVNGIARAKESVAATSSYPFRVAHHHARRSVESVLQIVPDYTEVW